MFRGSGEIEASSSFGMNSRDLLRLRLRPTAEPSRSMMLRVAESLSGDPTSDPTSVPSSRYHEFLFSDAFNNWVEGQGEAKGPKWIPC